MESVAGHARGIVDAGILAEGMKLERELNSANERISRLNDYVAALETAGDEMAKELSYGYDVDMWNQARGEAKP
jgi:hypothetical protein